MDRLSKCMDVNELAIRNIEAKLEEEIKTEGDQSEEDLVTL